MSGHRRILVWEYFTSGALELTADHQAILGEGRGMVEALVADLEQLRDLQISLLWNAALPAPVTTAEVVKIGPNEFARVARQTARGRDVLAIAPESDGILAGMVELVREAGGRWLGADESAIVMAADKLTTFRAWRECGAPTPITRLGHEPIPADWFPVVVKPRCGAGSENTLVLNHPDDFVGLCLNESIVQPLIEGEVCSVAAIVGARHTTILPIVTQRIAVSRQITYHGGVLQPRAVPESIEQAARLALRPLEPNRGWYGLDFVLTASDISLLEINPRLTTSYCAYRRATDANLAAFLIGPEEPTGIRWRTDRVVAFDATGGTQSAVPSTGQSLGSTRDLGKSGPHSAARFGQRPNRSP